ncbi:MAG TPA: SRPBCC family protein [Nitrososphaerales archaeon]|nr:SRPBCC family protein [Nitrososphaerales archaeon]
MIRLETSVIIDAPVEKVWEFLSNPDTVPEWTGVKDAKFDGPIRVGTTAKATLHFLGSRTLELTVSEYEPEKRKLGVEGTILGAKVHDLYSLEPTEGVKTRFTKTSTVEGGGLMRVFSPFMARRGKRTALTQMENVKRIVEAQGRTES